MVEVAIKKKVDNQVCDIAAKKSCFPKHIVSINDMALDQVEEVYMRANWMSHQSSSMLINLRKGLILGVLFFQNSTRTRISFEAAALRLGGCVTGFSDVATTRAGDFFQESLKDTVKIISQYVDCIVIRHPGNTSAAMASEVSRVPVISGGSGASEHPTQALLDGWMLKKRLGNVQGKVIGLVGDPKCRDLRSLIFLLIKLGIGEILFLSPRDCFLAEDEVSALNQYQVKWKIEENMQTLLDHSDAIFMIPFILPNFNVSHTKVSQENLYLDEKYQLTPEKIFKKGESCPDIFHVGPRGLELPDASVGFPKVHYYEQARHGVYLRAALIDLLMSQ